MAKKLLGYVRGEAGAPGATGPQGPQGPAGKNGIDGNYFKPATGIPMYDLSKEVQDAIEAGGGGVASSVIADDFNPAATYKKGEYVMYKNELYKRITDEPLYNPYIIDMPIANEQIFPIFETDNTLGKWGIISRENDNIAYGGFIKTTIVDGYTKEVYQPVYIARKPFAVWYHGSIYEESIPYEKDGITWYMSHMNTNNSDDSGSPIITHEDRYIGYYENTMDEELLNFVFGIVESGWNPNEWENVNVTDEIKAGGGELPDNLVYLSDSQSEEIPTVSGFFINYSTEEQLIGTWIDGKPLYQKTVFAHNLYVGQSTKLDLGIGNVDWIALVPDGTGFTDTTIHDGYNIFPYVHNNVQLLAGGYFNVSPASFDFRVGSSFVGNYDVYMTVRYTKKE